MTYGRLAQRERSCLTSKRSQVQILYLPPLITCHAFAWHFLFWAFSSAGEHFLHTEGVIGSIPVTPTICFKVRLRRTFFRYKRHVAARYSYGTAAAPSPLDVRSTLGACFHDICTRQNPARCFDQLRESINALWMFFSRGCFF